MRFEVVKKFNDPNTPKICRFKGNLTEGYSHIELKQVSDIESPGINHPAYDNYKDYISSLKTYICTSPLAAKLDKRVGDILTREDFAIKYTNGLREFDELPDINARLNGNWSEYHWCAVEVDRRYVDIENKPKITSEAIEPRVLAFESAARLGLSGKELEKHVKVFMDGYNAAIKNIIISGQPLTQK